MEIRSFKPIFSKDILQENPNKRKRFEQGIALFDDYVRHEKRRGFEINVEDIITKGDLEVIKISPTKGRMPDLSIHVSKLNPQRNISAPLGFDKPYFDLKIDDFVYRIYKEQENSKD